MKCPDQSEDDTSTVSHDAAQMIFIWVMPRITVFSDISLQNVADLEIVVCLTITGSYRNYQ